MATLTLNVKPDGAVQGSRRASKALDGVKRSARGADAALAKTSRTAAAAGRAFARVSASVVAVAVAVATKAVPAFRAQSKALAEVSTLIEGTEAEMRALDEASKAFAAGFGGSATTQVEGFYQAISAGVGDVTQATEFLKDANILAQAGVTDVTTAVNVLTTALNVYGKENLSASEASDILFSGVKAGKTTIGELSASLGKVLPVAKGLGIGLDEVVAAVAGLTAGGIRTRESVTGLRAVMQAVLKPAGDARDLAKALGLEFNTTALKSKKLTGFLQDVADKTAGNVDALAILFGGIEAVVPVMALAGNAGVIMGNTLQEMGEQAGIAAEQSDKVAASLDNRFAAQLGLISTKVVGFGEILTRGIVPALEAITSNAGTAAAALTGIGLAVALIAGGPFIATAGAVAAVAGAVFFLASQWDTVKIAAEVTLGRIRALTGPLFDFLKIGFSGVAALATQAWPLIGTAALGTLNGIIGAFVGMKSVGVAVWADIGNATGLFADSAQFVFKNIEAAFFRMMQSIQQRWTNFVSQSANVARAIPGAGGIADSLEASAGAAFTRLSELSAAVNEAEQLATAAGRRVAVALEEGVASETAAALKDLGANFGEDYVQDFVSGVVNETRRRQGELADALDPRGPHQLRADGGGGPAAVDSTPIFDEEQAARVAKALADLLNGILGGGGTAKAVDEVTRTIIELESELVDLLGSLDPTIARTLEFKQAQDLINEAVTRGVASTLEGAVALATLAGVYEDVDGSSGAFVSAQELVNQALKDGTLNAEQAKEALDALKDAYDQGTSAGDFFAKTQDDVERGIVQSILGFKSLESVAYDLATALAEAYLQYALFGSGPLSAGGAGSGGGLLSGLTDALFGAISAKGNVFSGGNVVPFASGGIVNGPTAFPMSGGRTGLMGEAGPEAVVPLRKGPGGRLGIEASGGGDSPDITNVIMLGGLPELVADVMQSNAGRRIMQEEIQLSGGAGA